MTARTHTAQTRRVTLVSMSGLRVVDPMLLDLGLTLPGLRRRADALAQLPPLGLLTLAAVVPDSWEADLVTDEGTASPREVAKRISDNQPDLIAFSTLTAAADRCKQISQHLRSDGYTTVVGGLHATLAPESMSDHFDCVVIGEGETTFPRLLADFDVGNLLPTYRSESPFDLAQTPTPKWSLLGEKPPPRFTLQTQRGCPWACSFCAASRVLGPARSKPMPNIRRELNAITQQQPRAWLELADDNTFAMQRDHEALLDSLRASGTRWFTESDWRLGTQPKICESLAASGCQQVLVGMESTVFRYPGMGAKNADWDAMMDATAAIQAAGVVVNACFIVGADGETPESIDRLTEFLCAAPFGEVQVTLQTPFPGTPLYRHLQKAGRLLSDRFEKHTLFDVTFHPRDLSVDDLQTAFHRLVGTVYSREQQSRRAELVKKIKRNRPRRIRSSSPA